MVAKIRAYIERAFADAPRTRKSVELQEELISNMLEKFNDLLREGKTEEEAYNAVIAGMGDIEELVDGLRERQTLHHPTPEERRRSALLVSIAVGLYILGPVALIGLSALRNPILGLCIMLTLVAAATGLLVYNAAVRPKYAREEETFVEEFKEWKSGREREKGIINSFSAAFSLIVVAIYLWVSFQYQIWSYSWIIFIVAAAIRNIAMAVYRMREGKNGW